MTRMAMHKPLRVLFILPDLSLGGAETVTLNIVSGLVAQGIDAGVHLMRDSPVASPLPDNLMVSGRVVKAKATSNEVFGRGRWLPLLRRAHRCDVLVGALELRSHLIAVLIGKVIRRPVVLWLHKDLETFLAKKSIVFRAVYRVIFCFVLHQCRAMVVVSDGSVKSAARLCAASASKLLKIYNPVRFSAIDAALQGAVQPKSKKFVLSVGRMVWQKGFDILIDAFAIVAPVFPHLQLIILGEGMLRPTLTQRAAALGLADRVHMPGFSSPYMLMSDADVFVLSSRSEGLSMVLIEAMYCGAPIVSTDCPSGPAEVLMQGKYGTLVPVY